LPETSLVHHQLKEQLSRHSRYVLQAPNVFRLKAELDQCISHNQIDQDEQQALLVA